MFAHYNRLLTSLVQNFFFKVLHQLKQMLQPTRLSKLHTHPLQDGSTTLLPSLKISNLYQQLLVPLLLLKKKKTMMKTLTYSVPMTKKKMLKLQS